MNKSIEELDVSKFEGTHKFLSEELLVPNINKTDLSRGVMFCSHLPQAVTLKNSENPLVFTNFEYQIGKYSESGYKKIKDDYTVVMRINKNKYNYDLIIKNTNTDEYDILHRTECEWLTEHYGYKWNNKKIDSLKPNDNIKKNTVVYKNDCYDEEMNFKYGMNLKTAYFNYDNYTIEDAVVISESVAKKMTTYRVNKVEISVNDNDLLLNLYGDKNNYKSFPDIGEEIKNRIVACRKRINYNTMIYETKDLTKINEGDTPFFVDGKIVDIDIYSNMSLDDMEEQVYNNQVCKYIKQEKNYFKEFYMKLKEIVESGKYKVSTNLLQYYNNCKKRLDNNVFYTYQSNRFNGFIIRFTTLLEEPLHIGSKITGRLTFRHVSM